MDQSKEILLEEIKKDEGSVNSVYLDHSTAFTLLGARVKKFLKPLGIGDTDYSKGIDEIVNGKFRLGRSNGFS